jgi:hypothetical protein
MLRTSLLRTVLAGGALAAVLCLAGGPGTRWVAADAKTIPPLTAPVAPRPTPDPVPGSQADPAPVTLQGPAGESAIQHQTTLADGSRCVTVVGQFSVAVTCAFAPAASQPTP